MPSEWRVLVVDSTGEAAEALDRSLSVTAVAAADPERALSALDGESVDCVVTELRFESDAADAGTPEEPRSSRNDGLAGGVALLGALRERDPTLPVVVYTDGDLDGLGPTALAGATACVEKTEEDAEATLAEWVERCVAARTGRRDRLTGVVHDLRNPLRAANVSLARLRRDADLDDGYVADLAAAHERLGDLLDDFDALVDAGRSVVDADIESVALDEAAREAWRTVDTRGATLQVETDATVDADRRKLRRLFENLFANAVEHGSTSPRSETPEDAVEYGSTSGESPTEDGPATDVTVTVGECAEGFFVADDGSGIDEADREVSSSVATRRSTTPATGWPSSPSSPPPTAGRSARPRADRAARGSTSGPDSPAEATPLLAAGVVRIVQHGGEFVGETAADLDHPGVARVQDVVHEASGRQEFRSLDEREVVVGGVGDGLA